MFRRNSSWAFPLECCCGWGCVDGGFEVSDGTATFGWTRREILESMKFCCLQNIKVRSNSSYLGFLLLLLGSLLLSLLGFLRFPPWSFVAVLLRRCVRDRKD